MELQDCQALIEQQIKTGARHRDYQHVCDLATDLMIYATGKGMVAKLKRVANREDEGAFEQRAALTIPITAPLVASVKGPFYKVTRNDRIKEVLEIGKNEQKKKQVEAMAQAFYGSARRKNRGLKFWLKTRYLSLSFADPNAWVAVEWRTPSNGAEVIIPKPFEISSAMAVNFEVINGETKWLLCRQPVKYKSGAGDQVTFKDGERFTLYDMDYTIVWEKVDKAYLDSVGYALRPGQRFITDEKNELWLEEWYKPNIGFVPAIRVGYKEDDFTLGRTYDAIYGAAITYFEKILKVGSEFDISMSLHAFPQKLQYYKPCSGASQAKRCFDGFLLSGDTCSECKGKGMVIHTSAQDVILAKMPTSKEEVTVKLEEMIAYKSPPIDILKFQDEYIERTGPKIHQAVFNSQSLVKKTSTSDSTEPDVSKTATEVDEGMQGVYDALEPYTEHQSEVYKDFMTIFALLAGSSIDEIEVDHIFPANPKLKSEDQLVSDYARAKESGAPSFLIDAITNELAEKVFIGNKTGKIKYDVRRRFFPFLGKSEDEISMLISTSLVPYRDQVLYGNFDKIFEELEMENAGFYIRPTKIQNDLLQLKITQYVERIEKEKPASAIDVFRNAIVGSGASGDAGGDPNPGENDDEDQNSNTDNPID